MSNLTLDGSTSFIGTEFIKLLNTGSSDLATVQYVDDAIEQNGGGGGNVDLSNYYTQTETDNLLNNKLNVNNPQDIIGTLRIDSTNGNGKLIINAVGAPNDEDFYVNGLSNLGGTLKAQLIQASSNIETSQQIKSNTINTYSISNMIIQRNAIPYITLDSQIVDDETVEKIILMKDVEFSGGLSLNTLSVDTLNTVGLNDMVFNINTLGEILRFEVGGTVRVPNNRSFISQNIFTDIIKPLTFSTDVVFYGGNNANDAYEEFIRLDASTERVNFSKIIDVNEDVIMKQTKVLYLDATANLQRYITTRNDNGQDILELVNNKATNNQIRFTNNGSTSLIVDNSFVFSQRQIQGNNGLKVDFIDTRNTNVDFHFRRSGATAITLKADNVVQFTGYLHINNISTENDTDMAIRRNDEEFIRLFKDGTTSAEAIFCYKQLRATQGFKATTIDTENVNDNLDFQRNGSSYMVFNSDRININQPLHLAGTLFIDTVNKLSLKPSLESGVNIFDIRNLHPVADNPMIRYRVGEGGGETIVCEMTNDRVSFQRNVLIGTAYELQTNTIDTVNDNDLVISRNNIPFLTLDKFTEDTIEKEAIICSKQLRANGNVLVNNLQINQFQSGVEYADFRLHNVDSVVRYFVGNSTNVNFQITNAGINLNRETTIGSVKTNTINSNGDNDLVFQRNGVEYFRLDDLTGTDILNVANDKGVSASYVFGNRFWNRSFSSDTTFFGSNVAGDDRVEYMKWNYLSQSVDYNAPIDNTGLAITGNIIDTTVSDERLKTNIEDVDTDFTSCIKNVKVKTFKYKDDKYKTNDNYGFIAQELKEHLPKECKNIVNENKVKNEDETFLSINYMKLSVVLWKCCQEQQSKIEHLEASMYEMMEDIKELKGKKTTKPKAKAKSKTKSENK